MGRMKWLHLILCTSLGCSYHLDPIKSLFSLYLGCGQARKNVFRHLHVILMYLSDIVIFHQSLLSSLAFSRHTVNNLNNSLLPLLCISSQYVNEAVDNYFKTFFSVFATLYHIVFISVLSSFILMLIFLYEDISKQTVGTIFE